MLGYIAQRKGTIRLVRCQATQHTHIHLAITTLYNNSVQTISQLCFGSKQQLSKRYHIHLLGVNCVNISL